jgi:hypothetical protein
MKQGRNGGADMVAYEAREIYSVDGVDGVDSAGMA